MLDEELARRTAAERALMEQEAARKEAEAAAARCACVCRRVLFQENDQCPHLCPMCDYVMNLHWSRSSDE